jgi:hypothetical protein
MLPAISAASSIACSVANTLDLPTGIVTSTSAAKTSTATPGTGTGAGMASTATGTSAASTSKAGAERGTDHAMPVLGGLLGAFIGAVGIFL